MTSELYTPTTQTVRKIFADYANMTEVQRKRDKAAFDRWLSEVEAAAEQRGAVKALRDAAESVKLANDYYEMLVEDDLNEQADRIEGEQ